VSYPSRSDGRPAPVACGTSAFSMMPLCTSGASPRAVGVGVCVAPRRRAVGASAYVRCRSGRAPASERGARQAAMRPASLRVSRHRHSGRRPRRSRIHGIPVAPAPQSEPDTGVSRADVSHDSAHRSDASRLSSSNGSPVIARPNRAAGPAYRHLRRASDRQGGSAHRTARTSPPGVGGGGAGALALSWWAVLQSLQRMLGGLRSGPCTSS